MFSGQGFTLVYTSIYFVNELDFSLMQVGFAIVSGSGSISETVGRFGASNTIMLTVQEDGGL